MTKLATILFTAHPENGPAGHALIKIDGREVFLKSIDAFLNRDPIGQILLCFTPDFVEQAKTKFASHLMFAGVKVVSGTSMFEQLASAAAKLSPDITHVIVQDAARCVVPSEDIDQLIEAADKHDAVALSARAGSAMIEMDDGNALRTIAAKNLRSLLFPHMYSRQILDEVVKHRQLPSLGQLRLIDGHPFNVRVNSPADASLIKTLIAQMPKPKSTGPSNPFDEASW